jgi:galactofuranose transport system permease protein
MAVSTTTGSTSVNTRWRWTSALQRQGALLALALLVAWGALRYDGFLSYYNIAESLRYNAMFGLLALGMTFVIMTGGIDLSVGRVAALASVLAALLSPYGLATTLVVVIGVGVLLGLCNGLMITRLGIPPFIATLAMFLAARGLALVLAPNGAVSLDNSSGFDKINSGSLFAVDAFGGIPVPALLLVLAFVLGAIALNYTRWGRHVLAIGGNEEASRLMGLPADAPSDFAAPPPAAERHRESPTANRRSN